jgi:uncharacterized membrane protein YvbJ
MNEVINFPSCKNCEQEILDNSVFCSNCGNKIKEANYRARILQSYDTKNLAEKITKLLNDGYNVSKFVKDDDYFYCLMIKSW